MSNARQQKYPQAKGFNNQSRDHAERFKRSLPERFFLRIHMALIMLAVGIVGVITSKLLIAFGMTDLLARYLLSVTIAYGAFFMFMRVWLWYIRDSSSDSWHADIDPVDGVDVINLSGNVLSGSADAKTGGGFEGFGGGGDFGGGGADEAWGEAATAPARIVPVPIRSSGGSNVSSSKASSGGGFDLDFDEGAIVLVVFAVLVVVIFGAGAYLVYQAPAILSEAVFEALLASSLIKAANRIDTVGFMGSIFKATRIPFLIVLAMTLIFGLVAGQLCPEATKLADIIKGCPSS